VQHGIYKISVYRRMEIKRSWGLNRETNWGWIHVKSSQRFCARLRSGWCVLNDFGRRVVLSTVCRYRWYSNSRNSNWLKDTCFDNENWCSHALIKYRLWIEDHSWSVNSLYINSSSIPWFEFRPSLWVDDNENFHRRLLLWTSRPSFRGMLTVHLQW
jgi:hypothetical protein